MIFIKKIQNAFKHVGSGKNLTLWTLIRNVSPYFLSPQGKAKSPLTIYFSVNSVCNLTCQMCDIGQKNSESSFYKNLQPESPKEKLDFDRLQELIREASKFDPQPRISVTTTEPFLYPDLFKLSELVSSHGMEFQVTTNGAYIKKHMDEIFSSGISELCISVDGPGEIHNEIRGKVGLYESIVADLTEIQERKKKQKTNKPALTIATVISNFNYKFISDLYDDLPENIYDNAIVSHMNFMDEEMVSAHNKDYSHVGLAVMAGLPGACKPDKVNVDDLWKQVLRIKANKPKVKLSPDFNQRDLEVFYKESMEFVWDNTCYIPWFVMEILSNGDAIPLTRCFNLKLGNIYENSISEIWNGEGYRQLRKELIKNKRFPVCTRCRGIL
jgi:MoaA/NifB/PqqE/SkfB family radical SAM enzyme